MTKLYIWIRPQLMPFSRFYSINITWKINRTFVCVCGGEGGEGGCMAKELEMISFQLSIDKMRWFIKYWNSIFLDCMIILIANLNVFLQRIFVDFRPRFHRNFAQIRNNQSYHHNLFFILKANMDNNFCVKRYLKQLVLLSFFFAQIFCTSF